MVIKIDAQHGWQKERERERERDAYEIWQRMGSRVAKFRVGTRAKGGNRASTSRKLKPIKHNGERRSEGFTGIAISHDHLIISLQSCHFAFVELATCLECSRTNVVDDTRSPSLEEREKTGPRCQVLLHGPPWTRSFVATYGVPYGHAQCCIDTTRIPILLLIKLLTRVAFYFHSGDEITVGSNGRLWP